MRNRIQTYETGRNLWPRVDMEGEGGVERRVKKRQRYPSTSGMAAPSLIMFIGSRGSLGSLRVLPVSTSLLSFHLSHPGLANRLESLEARRQLP